MTDDGCPAWFPEILDGGPYPVRDGIVDTLTPEMHQLLAPQRSLWQCLARQQRTHRLPLRQVLYLPEEPSLRAQLEWLRARLRGRGLCSVLELGCGRGWAARVLAEDGHRVVASDILADASIGLGCAVRQRTATGRWFGCVLATAEKLPFRSEMFDCVFCFATLRHLPDWQRVFREVVRVLRPGGLFIAFQEPFRGILTTARQRLQGGPADQLARRQLARPVSACSPFRLTEVCRQVPLCVNATAEAGLRATVLPSAAMVLGPSAAWLTDLAGTYRLDSRRLGTWLTAARNAGLDLESDLLAHWTLVGNCDGVVLASKEDDAFGVPSLPLAEPERCRWLEPLLLACAADGFIPVYGFVPNQTGWLHAEAGLLVPAGEAAALVISGPGPRWLRGPVEVEARIENEPLPCARFTAIPGKTSTVVLPLQKCSAHTPVLVRLTAVSGVHLGPLRSRLCGGTAWHALRLHAVRTVSVCPESVAALLQGRTAAHARMAAVSSQGA